MRKVSVATLCYTALTLLVTFPLVLHLRSGLPSDLGDPLLSTTLLWWNAHVLPLTERWWNGFAFAPGTGMMAFSDHRLGMSLIATPLQWLGASPITAYNIVFLSTFPLCALGGYALGLALTERHDAAFLCGLAYAFTPFRVAHIGHIELLAGFAMPAALAALHMYSRDRRARWIGLFTAALIVQALCGTYYLFFFFVLSSLWVLWFVRPREWRFVGMIAGAFGVTVLLLSPIAIQYARIHQLYGFSRALSEIESYSADLASIVAGSSRLRFWSFTYIDPNVERQLFPGLTVVLLALAGLVAPLRRAPADDGRWRRAAMTSLVLSCVFSAVALSWTFFGTWSIAIGAWRILRVTDAFKPTTLALVALAIAVTARPAIRRAWGDRSSLAFYGLAAAFLFLCAMGPEPTFFGEQILYKPPYAWFMSLPLVGTSMRAPGRFGMLMILALAATAAVAFNRLRVAPRTRRGIVVLAAAGLLVDGWSAPIDVVRPPPLWPVPPGVNFGAVVELPLHPLNDVPAMYRATLHGHPVANGNSGFFPTHYFALLRALESGNPRALQALSRSGPLLVVVDRSQDPDGRWNRMMSQAEYAERVTNDTQWTLYRLDAPPDVTCHAPALPIASLTGQNGAPVDLHPLTDGRIDTRWTSSTTQQFDDHLEIDLGRVARLCAVRMSLGPAWEAWPRDLEVTTSADGTSWTRQFKGSPGRFLIEGAVENPRDVWLTVPANQAQARFVRLRLDAGHPTLPWLMTELRVTGF